MHPYFRVTVHWVISIQLDVHRHAAQTHKDAAIDAVAARGCFVQEAETHPHTCCSSSSTALCVNGWESNYYSHTETTFSTLVSQDMCACVCVRAWVCASEARCSLADLLSPLISPTAWHVHAATHFYKAPWNTDQSSADNTLHTFHLC